MNGDFNPPEWLVGQTENKEIPAIPIAKDGPKLTIVKNCGSCPFVGPKKGCHFVQKPKCECEKPELGIYYFSNLSDFGLCRNCHHFIVCVNGKDWVHYFRAYQCKSPYCGIKCCAPATAKELSK